MSYRIYHCMRPGGDASFVCRESDPDEPTRSRSLGALDSVARVRHAAPRIERADVGRVERGAAVLEQLAGGMFEVRHHDPIRVGSAASADWVLTSPRMPSHAMDVMRIVDTLFVRAAPNTVVHVDGQRVSSLWVPAPPGTRLAVGGVQVRVESEGRLRCVRFPSDSFVSCPDEEDLKHSGVAVDLSLPIRSCTPPRAIDTGLRRALRRLGGAFVRPHRDSYC